jgi:S1-C subfamily serine protease
MLCRSGRRALAPTVVVALILAGCGGSDPVADKPTKPKVTPERKLTPEQVVERVGPATVKLSGRFGNIVASGSGAIIDAKRGLVLTNSHVVSGVEALKAQINDTQTATARVLAQAPCDDVALVQIVAPPAGLKAFEMGASGAVKPGQHISVLGYPATLEETDSGSSSKLTVTSGTVSNPQTSAQLGAGSPRYPALIQHQAPVNHGNSGGPLVDDYGRLIGLNTLTGAGSDKGGQTQGQYYAISIDRIKDALLPSLTAGKDISDYGWTLNPVTTDLLYEYYGDDARKLTDAVINFLNKTDETEGLMVLGTDPGSSAERNHFVVGDYITEINDTPVTSVGDVCEIVESKAPGDTLQVEGRLLSLETPSEDFGRPFTENIRVPRGETVTQP